LQETLNGDGWKGCGVSEQLSDRIDGIRSAIIALGRHAPDFLQDQPDFLKRIQPLIDAIKWHDHDTIVKALWQRTISIHEKDMIVLHNITYLIATNPKKYGVERLTKTDVLEILRTDYPETDHLVPTSKRGLSDFWKQVGVDLDQGRGAINPNLRKWLKTRVAEVVNDACE
jgi:hypothetical protein